MFLNVQLVCVSVHVCRRVCLCIYTYHTYVHAYCIRTCMPARLRCVCVQFETISGMSDIGLAPSAVARVGNVCVDVRKCLSVFVYKQSDRDREIEMAMHSA